jgi:hypothetical protein
LKNEIKIYKVLDELKKPEDETLWFELGGWVQQVGSGGGGAWTGLSLLRIGTGGRLLWMR